MYQACYWRETTLHYSLGFCAASYIRAICSYFRHQLIMLFLIIGDRRIDSPGHYAQYCSDTFMGNTTKKILCIITMDKRETDRKSTNLEKACFLKGLKFLLDKGLWIKEVVTDAHMQIRAVMSKLNTLIEKGMIWSEWASDKKENSTRKSAQYILRNETSIWNPSLVSSLHCFVTEIIFWYIRFYLALHMYSSFYL